MTEPTGLVRWRYHYVDFATGTPIAVLPMRSVTLSDVLSGASEGEGEIPLSSPEVESQDPYAATQQRKTLCFARRSRLDPATRAEVSYSVPWCGLTMRRSESFGGRSLKVKLVTLPSYFQFREVGSHTFTDADPLAVQRTLFAEGAACRWDGSVPPVFEDLTADVPTSPALTTRDYVAGDHTPTLEAVSKLAVETGFDWRIRPYWDPAARRFRVRLDQGWPRLGRIASADLVWSGAGNRGRAGFLMAGDIVEDGNGVLNRLTALGSGSGPTQLRATVDSSQVPGRDEQAAGYVIFEGSLSSSTQELRTQSQVDAHALGSLAAGLAAEVRVAGLKVRGDLEPDLASWLPGDDGTVVLPNRRHRTTGAPLTVVGQITGRKIEPAEQGGTETVTFDLQGTAA